MKNNILSVSQFTQTTRVLIESNFQSVWISGEISNLARPSSGHLYFSLKDERAQVRCAFFKMQARAVKFPIENGQQVLVKAQASLYEPRGDFQLIVREMQLSGEGALQVAFEKLKEKLQKQGLFSEAHKKPLPKLPKQIGIVTSETGAALQDILRVLKRRMPSIPVIVYPTMVQGELAAGNIVKMIALANTRNECDVLIVSRGGGSLEDLWSFNEESVARAIFKSDIPVVSGVGHEVDFTIADFVADLRAATPSAAAECVSPDCQEWLNLLSQYQQRFTHLITTYLSQCKTKLLHLQQRLRHPGEVIRLQMQQVDQYEQRLMLAMQHIMKHATQQLREYHVRLEAISPLKTLARGYAIVSAADSGAVITKASQVKKGDALKVRLSEGELFCKSQ